MEKQIKWTLEQKVEIVKEFKKRCYYIIFNEKIWYSKLGNSK